MIKKLLKEFLGTFVLVLMGTTVISLTGGNMFATALAFGFGLVAAATIFGGHFNPAVSLAKFAHNDISFLDFILYFISQVLGGLLASVLLLLFLGENANLVGLGANDLQGSFKTATGGVFVALGLETILTFIFVLVVLKVTKEDKKLNPLLLGMVLIGIVIVGFNVTGTSVNPARSISPALLQGVDSLKHLWIFIIAPILGGSFAGLVSKYLE